MSELRSKLSSVNWQRMLFVLMLALLVAGADSCKSSGKMSKKERKAAIEAAKLQLQPIIAGTSTLSYDEQKQIVGDIKAKNLNDPVLNEMISQAERKLKQLLSEQTQAKAKQVDIARAKLYDLLLNKDNKSADELEREMNAIKRQNLGDSEIDELLGRLEKKIEEMRSGKSALPVRSQLDDAFNAIITASRNGDLSKADNLIQNTLKLFSSDDVPVLIIISREGSVVDYDKPTTIKRYLQLLKDTKTNRNNIDAVMNDDNGKIKGLDLIKKY